MNSLYSRRNSHEFDKTVEVRERVLSSSRYSDSDKLSFRNDASG
jgi:hypothetical protein